MSVTRIVELPFFDAAHGVMAEALHAWCKANVAAHGQDDMDAECRALVRRLGAAGWLRYCVPAAYGGMHAAIDSRAVCLARETLAYHHGLADFAFAMQGLGSGAISLHGSDAHRIDKVTEADLERYCWLYGDLSFQNFS